MTLSCCLSRSLWNLTRQKQENALQTELWGGHCCHSMMILKQCSSWEQRRPGAIPQGHWRHCPLLSQVALLVAVILPQPGSWPSQWRPHTPFPRQGEVLVSGRGFLTGPGRWWEQASQAPSLSSEPQDPGCHLTWWSRFPWRLPWTGSRELHWARADSVAWAETEGEWGFLGPPQRGGAKGEGPAPLRPQHLYLDLIYNWSPHETFQKPFVPAQPSGMVGLPFSRWPPPQPTHHPEPQPWAPQA